jgi:uncharacterized protein YdeI (YjbR/CyaY-like superfamily)
MNKKNPNLDTYFSNPKNWPEESVKLRGILLDCPLTEELKWGKPCYIFEKSNIVIIQGFKEYCALLFFKGALLKDHYNILVQQTENVQSARQIRFTNLQEINKMESILKAYINEAIEIEKADLKVDFKQKNELIYPEEFQKQLDDLPALKTAFEALTPGRQRYYNLHFSGAKQSKTRAARVEKAIPKILKGKGLNDQ